MIFKEWLLLQESIIIDMRREEVALGKSNEAGKVVEFSYATDDYHSVFEIWPFSEQRPGYANFGNATVVGIIKKTPIFPGNGADRAFINALSSSLKAAGYKPLPYKEGDSEWLGAFKDAGVDDEKVLGAMKGEKDSKTAETPKMGDKSPADRKVSSGISVSRQSGSWAYFVEIRPGDAEFYIRSFERIMKAAIQPMVDRNLVDYYRIVRGWNYKAEEWVWSEKGKREKEERENSDQKTVAYMKFLAERMLANHPKAKARVLGHFRNSWDKDIAPSPDKVPMDELKSYVNHNHSESPFLHFFLETIQSRGQHMYEVLEGAAEIPNCDRAVSIYKEISEDNFEHMVENPRLYMTHAADILSISEFLTKSAGPQFEKFRSEYEKSINDWLKSGPTVSHYDLESLNKLSDHIEIHGKESISKDLDDHKKREGEQRKKIEQHEADTRQMIVRGGFKYMVLGKDPAWKDVSHNYINHYKEVDVGLMALEEDIVDRENIMHAAHEKASEDAWADAEEKKSETYGQDMAEVESDIDHEWDEYMDEREFEEGEFDGLSDDKKKEKVKEEYFDDFVGWKIDRLKKEEEQESWKYEPEADESKIREYEEKFAEEQAYEDGLVVMRWLDEDPDDIEVFVHPNHYQKAREMVRKSLAIGMSRKDKHGEPIVRKDQRVDFQFTAEGSKEPQVMRAREL